MRNLPELDPTIEALLQEGLARNIVFMSATELRLGHGLIMPEPEADSGEA